MATSDTHRGRAYELWTDERNLELVELLRGDLREDEIADQIGRSIAALRTQCRKMIPPHLRVPGNQVVSTLALLVQDRDYDWRAPLRDLAALGRTLYWDSQMCQRLREGWDHAETLDELCRRFAASEIEIARQLMRLGLAEDCSQVADRLGCDPHGTLAGRLRVAADRAAAAVWILIVDGALTGTATGFGDHGPERRHVSVHHDYDTADLTMAEVMLDHVAAGGLILEITATITERTLGEATLGFNSFRTGAEILPATETTLDLDDNPFP